MSEYSPAPGTLRSKLGRAETDEPWTRNSTGRDGSPLDGAAMRLRNSDSDTVPFFAQYSALQSGRSGCISGGAAARATRGDGANAGAAANAPSPRPARVISARRETRSSVSPMAGLRVSSL